LPRYFLSLRYKGGPDGLAIDDEGDELPNLGALRAHVLESARDLMHKTHIGAIPDWSRCTLEVTDETGHRVLTLRFAEALS